MAEQMDRMDGEEVSRRMRRIAAVLGRYKLEQPGLEMRYYASSVDGMHGLTTIHAQMQGKVKDVRGGRRLRNHVYNASFGEDRLLYPSEMRERSDEQIALWVAATMAAECAAHEALEWLRHEGQPVVFDNDAGDSFFGPHRFKEDALFLRGDVLGSNT